jgi:type I restriction enzyme S subunit
MNHKFYKETDFKEVVLNDEVVKIPKDWEVVKLKDIVKMIKSGGTPSTKKPEFWDGNIPFVKIEDISGENKYLYRTKNYITEEGLKNSNAWLVPVNSLLLAMYGSIGEAAINKIKIATNQAILGIVPTYKVDVEFLYYFFKYFKKELIKKSGETTQKNINAQIVKEFQILLPPLEEQKAIANILQKFDELLEIYNQEIETLQRIKKALMKKFFTEGVFEHKEFKEVVLNDEIVKIPKDWEVVKLGKISKSIFYGVTAKATKENTGLKFLRTTEIIDFKFDYDKLPYAEITNNVKDLDKYTLKEGDILIARAGSIGVSTISDKDYKNIIFGSYLIKVELSKEKIFPYFLYYFLQSNFFLGLLNSANEGVRKNINKPFLENLDIILPPLEEQKAIAEKLSKIDELIEIKKQKKEQVQKFKKIMMKKLLSGEIRVKI